jgi:tetratricopeptide (TPR) repeat protein
MISSNKRVLSFVIALFSLLPLSANKADLDHLYKMAQFSRIAAVLEKSGFEALSPRDKSLYIESLARSARRKKAEELSQKTMADDPLSFPAHLAAGVVHTSLGQFSKARSHLKEALFLNPKDPRTPMAMMMIELYLKNTPEALKMYEEFKQGNPGWSESYLSYLLGIEVYGAARNISKIADLYKIQAKIFKKIDNEQHKNLRKNFHVYRKASRNKAFLIKTPSDKVSLPFVQIGKNDSYAAVSLRVKDKPYKVLLDTGNRTGWTIHSRELEKQLRHRPGGTLLTRIGTEEEMLHGHLILTEHIDFGDLTIQNLPGVYIPKPHPGYPEGNLNPLFIQDRVVTLDFIKKRMILRTKERFHADLANSPSKSEKIMTSPWYGYEQAFLPAVINGAHRILAMIETGAGDITVNLEFAQQHRWHMEEAAKYLPSGKEFSYHKASLQLNIGSLGFRRRSAEVWSLDRLADPITGFIPDILLGPEVFKNKYALTFDPFRKKILITGYSF